jgi:hypothetical protein
MDTSLNLRYRVGSVEFLEQIHMIPARTKTTISIKHKCPMEGTSNP